MDFFVLCLERIFSLNKKRIFFVVIFFKSLCHQRSGIRSGDLHLDMYKDFGLLKEHYSYYISGFHFVGFYGYWVRIPEVGQMASVHLTAQSD